MRRVWYVAYGSNLAFERFRCYLSGGRLVGNTREYAGCRDSREPDRLISVEVQGGLAFAGQSAAWGGGIAFYDAHAPGRVAGRGYLVTTEQFADITAQEIRRPPGGEFARHLAEVLPTVDAVHTTGPGHYATVIPLGVRDGVPMLTVTIDDLASLELAAPCAPYLGWICAGLYEAHGWHEDRIAAYLAYAPGMKGSWTPEDIAALARARIAQRKAE